MTTPSTPANIIPVAARENNGSISIAPSAFIEIIEQKYTAAQQETLSFWYFAARERGWSLAKTSEVSGVSSTVLTRLFRGVYNADPSSAIATLERAKVTFHESSSNPDFIETSLYARLTAICDKTRALQNIAIAWGPPGIGKTECLQEYQRRNNHGRTQLVRYPTNSSPSYFIHHLARGLGVSFRAKSSFNTREQIIRVLSAGQRLLIIDELHQAFLTTRADSAVKSLELLREISDVAKCGLVLIGTEVLADEIFQGPHKLLLTQLVDRGTVQVPLPAKATQGDYKKFLTAYGLQLPDASADPEAHSILTDIIKASGLRKLTLHLRDAASYAAKRSEPLTWDHFTAAFRAITTLSK
jgi:DNA transposition AAA+ family ATPase